jgi:hypothetical protein
MQSKVDIEGDNGMPPVRLGLRENRSQIALLLLIVVFIGAVVGVERSVLPLLAKSEFGLTSATVTISFLVAFGFAVVAEGVENEAVRDELIDMKCDIAQGYLYARPMPQQEFIEWLNQYEPSKSAEQQSICSDVLAVATVKNR